LPRRRINGVVLATIAAGLAALGVAYVLIPKLDRHNGAVAARAYQVTILDERPLTREEIAATVKVRYPGSDGRAQRFAVVTDDGKTIEARTAADFRAATGRPAEYNAIVAPGDHSMYLGKLIRIDNASVITVPGDKLFSIGPTETDSLLVKMDEPTNPGAKSETELVVDPGDTVFVVGRIERMPPEATLKKWGLDDQERTWIGRQDVYLKARLVEDVTSP
jgi:hypothetical protein